MKELAAIPFVLLLVGLGPSVTRGQPAPSIPAPAVDGAVDWGATEWAKSPGTAPSVEEWAKATVLSKVDGDTLGMTSATCETSALHGWVHVVCKQLQVDSDNASGLSAVWGVAGNLENVKVEAHMVGTAGLGQLMREGVATVSNMASSFDITFPLTEGQAQLIEVSGGDWAHEEYNGNFFTAVSPGLLIDASWALGEKAPTLIFGRTTRR